MDFKLVVFDLDGVLVDACEWHRVALNQSLVEVCGYEISEKEHYSTFNGIPTKKKLDILEKRGLVKKTDRKLIYEQKQLKTIELIKNRCPRRPEKIKMLAQLRSAGVKLACYTNSISETGELMLRYTGIRDFFDVFLSNESVSNPKPDPEGYKRLMDFFKVKKEETLIIEDSPKGFEAAYKSGACVFRVSNPTQVDTNLFKEFIL